MAKNAHVFRNGCLRMAKEWSDWSIDRVNVAAGCLMADMRVGTLIGDDLSRIVEVRGG
ncbi:hypothetical protein ACXIZN_04925 [Amycolatopsis sp. TRM77291]